MLGLTAVTLLALSARAGPISFNPAFVEPLDAVSDQLRGWRPFVADFRRDGRELLFVSAGHEGALDGPTHRLLERIFARYRVDRAIVEGRRYADGDAAVERGPETGYVSEDDYAVRLARRRGASAIGGEPTDRELLRAARAAGFSQADWLGKRFLAWIPVWRREGRLRPGALPRLFNETMRRHRRDAGIGPRLPFSYGDFLLWYERRMGSKFDPEAIDVETTEPEERGRLCVQRLASVEDLVRNRFMLARLSEELRRRRRVLVVYGNGHFAAVRRAVEAAMGQPVYTGDLSR